MQREAFDWLTGGKFFLSQCGLALYFKLLASFYSCRDLFVSELAENPKDRISPDKAYI